MLNVYVLSDLISASLIALFLSKETVHTNIKKGIMMKNPLPKIEGAYFMIDSDGNKQKVRIVDMALSASHPKNLHVFEGSDDYYALSIENGYDQYAWEKL